MELTIQNLIDRKEDQTFDRKSARKDPKGLSNHIVAFANADGGVLVVGIEDDLKITGIDDYTENVNEIMRVPFDYCKPSVKVNFSTVECTDFKGKPNHVLVMEIPQCKQVHANQQDDVYYRMGDKSKKLGFEERLSLMNDKGDTYYEDSPVAFSTLEDIDLDAVKAYCDIIGYSKSPESYIRENGYLINVSGREEMSVAAILLFGKNPQKYFPRAWVRFIRYDVVTAEVGTKMNVVKDVTFAGRIIEQIEKTVEYIKVQMKEKTYLGHDGIFITEEEYSEFVRTEIVVNAVTHRDYSIKGTDIQIKMFDDRLEVDSPGGFAGRVRKDNIRYTHFSRNPKIAAYLKNYGYVKEFGEGVDRMCRELEAVGLPDPTFNNDNFILRTTVRSSAFGKQVIQLAETGDSASKQAIQPDKSGDLASKQAIQKITFEEILWLCNEKGYSNHIIINIQRLYGEIETNQIFNSSYIAKTLDIADSNARNLLSKLRDIDVVVPIKGKVKGQYRFKYSDEL